MTLELKLGLYVYKGEKCDRSASKGEGMWSTHPQNRSRQLSGGGVKKATLSFRLRVDREFPKLISGEFVLEYGPLYMYYSLNSLKGDIWGII